MTHFYLCIKAKTEHSQPSDPSCSSNKTGNIITGNTGNDKHHDNQLVQGNVFQSSLPGK